MKIGYIDHYLDDWHANHFTPMFEERSSGRCKVAYAFGMESNPRSGVTSQQWCEKFGVTLCDSIEEVVEKSDVLFVAAPNEGDLHEYLSKAALSSGKPTYVDKVMADTLESAKRMAETARLGGTPIH